MNLRRVRPAQCNILDPLCPNEPKGKNPTGTTLILNFLIIFNFLFARKK